MGLIVLSLQQKVADAGAMALIEVLDEIKNGNRVRNTSKKWWTLSFFSYQGSCKRVLSKKP